MTQINKGESKMQIDEEKMIDLNIEDIIIRIREERKDKERERELEDWNCGRDAYGGNRDE